jgi:hypothetical protein
MGSGGSIITNGARKFSGRLMCGVVLRHLYIFIENILFPKK